jgi:16S rRNA (cytosine967-C5)-methyltransferase
LAQAAVAVAAVIGDGRSADDALDSAAARPDRAAVRAIALGTLRWYLRLQPALTPLLTRPFADMPAPLSALLVAAAHQIEYSRAAPEASVHLAVDATRLIGAGGASGFVNAVLRKFVSQRAQLLATVDTDLARRTAHPVWLVDAVVNAWGDAAPAVFAANNAHPPMTVRIDLSRGSVAEFLRDWRAGGRDARAVDWCPGAVTLERPVPVAALPGFDRGVVSVQDTAAQLAARLLAPADGMRVADICAAPGGKTLHLLELAPAPAILVAIDSDAARLELVQQNLTRAGRTAQLLVADMTRRPDELAPESFDRVLVDPPCSSTGVIRRHPDIKHLRRASDLEALAVTQRAVLRTAFELLKPGGRLVYATCSLLPAENERLVAAFLAGEPRAAVLPWPEDVQRPPGALERPVGLQLLPGQGADTDGFYYACLTKA